MASHQARLAVDSRAFPLLIFDPRKGDRLKEKLSLQGNPATKNDWWTNPKTKEEVTFFDFARSEGRFVKHFDQEGNPSETMQRAPARSLGKLATAARVGRRDLRFFSAKPLSHWPACGLAVFKLNRQPQVLKLHDIAVLQLPAARVSTSPLTSTCPSWISNFACPPVPTTA